MGCFTSCFGASNPREDDVDDENPREDDDDDGNDRVLRIEILDQESILSDSSQVLKVETVNINSTLFATKSPFFHKMFSNGMRESKEKEVTLKIAAYEEVAFMELMDYIKLSTLPKRNESWLLELLVIADKFEVSSCVKSCIDSLRSLTMTCELALLFSSLPTGVYTSGLMDSVYDFFRKNIDKLDDFPEDIGGFEQGVIEVVLSRDDLRVNSEDIAYDFLMKWVDSHFSDSEERREFLHCHVRELIRFPHMSESKLSEFEQCPNVDKEFALEIKSECLRRPRSGRKLLYARRHYYVLLPLEIKRPENEDEKKCEVFFEFNKEGLLELKNQTVQNSKTITVGGHDFYVAFECKSDNEKNTLHILDMRLCMREVKWLTLVNLGVAYAVKRRPDEFEGRKQTGRQVFNRRRHEIVVKHFLGTELEALLIEDSKFFVDGTLLLKVTIHVLN